MKKLSIVLMSSIIFLGGVAIAEEENNYIFSTDYFSGNIKQWSRTTQALKGKENIRCLEVGSFEGRSTIFTAENICNGKDSVVYAVDTWEGSDEHTQEEKLTLYDNFKHNLKNHLDSGKVIELRGKSDEILLKLLSKIKDGNEKKFDFAYIDASHWAKDVMVDTVLAWEALKVGGIMIFDDFYWNVGNHDHVGPNPAITGFLKSYNSMYKIIYSGYQLHIKKISDRPKDEPGVNQFDQFYWKPFVNKIKVLVKPFVPEFALEIYRKNFK